MKAGHWSVPVDAGRERRTRSEAIIFHEARIWKKIPQVPGSPGRTFIWAAKGTFDICYKQCAMSPAHVEARRR